MARIKLFYTVEEEEVLSETAKLINLGADDVQEVINLFGSVQKELRGGEEKEVPNINKALEMIDEFRKALLNVDTRLEEATAIIRGFENYKREGPPMAPVLAPAEGDPQEELYGAD